MAALVSRPRTKTAEEGVSFRCLQLCWPMRCPEDTLQCCAKHIIAAGLKRVVYVEPYPKSLALDLFKDSLRIHGTQVAKAEDRQTVFEPFQGIGPRRFFDLFSMTLSWGTKLRRKAGWRKVEWSAKTSSIRVPLLPNTYIDREKAAKAELHALGEEDDNAQDHTQSVD